MPNRLKEFEVRLERTEHELHLLQRISRFMARDLGLNEALHGIVPLVVEFLRCDSCLVYLLDGNRLVLRASNRESGQAHSDVALNLDEGLTGWVARERRLLAISREAYNDSRFKFFKDLPEDTFEAFLSAPIISRNRVLGVINVQHRAPHTHTGSELELLSTVGELLGCLVLLSRNGAGGTASLTDQSAPVFA